MKHSVRGVAEGLWQLSFHALHERVWFLSTNCWLYKESASEELTLIDAGYPENAPAIIEAIRAIDLPLSRIVLTHAHPDHAGGAEEISQTLRVPVYAHEKDVPFVRTYDTRSMADEDGSAICRYILRHTPARYEPPKIANLHAIEDMKPLAGLVPYHTPGHTPGSITLWSPELKAVFCGDNLHTTIGRPSLGISFFCLSAAERNNSLRTTLKLPIAMVLSGHGPAYDAKDGAGLNSLRALLNKN